MSLKELSPEQSHIALFISVGMSPENVGKKFNRSPQAIRQLKKDPLFDAQVKEFINEISGKVISRHVEALNEVQDALIDAIRVQKANMKQTTNLTEAGRASERIVRWAGFTPPPDPDEGHKKPVHLRIEDRSYKGDIAGIPEADKDLLQDKGFQGEESQGEKRQAISA